ncbi:hypothetical protein L798_08617 [Zootermopsis nevadensis]|uniref:Ionotropic glutamate receptor C-terminal domain-containing protein n=1 Tax=Zootermopsis nevadensis TaxID=136037 RepID=A0A067RAX3_ZOONE|nr:hypothetical protein L798_08617 [Zootermopsis nevadensis]
MWTASALLFTTILFWSAGLDRQRLKKIAEVVFTVQRHLHSGCVSLLLSSALEGTNANLVLVKLLSAKGITTTTLCISTLNVTHDDTNCRLNRPLYVMTHDATLELKQLTATMSPTGPTWLLFSDSALKLDHLFTDVYIPLDCEFLVAREDLAGNVTLHEVYRMNRTMPLMNLQVAVWSPQFGVLWDNRSLYDRRNNLYGVTNVLWDNRSLYERRNNLYGVTIKATTFENPPNVEPKYNADTVEIGGTFGRVWSILSEELNYTTEVYLPEVNGAGASSGNGTWSGVIQLLVDGTVDVAVGDVTMTSHRASAIDFSVPLLISRVCIFIRRPESSYQALNNILAPFSSELWFTIQGAMVGLAACLSLVYHVGRRYDGLERPDLYTLPQALLCVFEIFCQQGHDETPRSWSCRLIYWVSYMAAVVLFAAYSGALVSFLAMQRVEPPFRTLRGLMQHGGYRVATVANSAHFNSFDQTTDETMRNIYEKMFDKNLPNTTLEGLKNLCSIKNYAFMTTYDTVLLFWKNANCSFMALKEASFPETLSIAFSKGSPYLGVINFKLQQMRDTGVLYRILNNAWSSEANDDRALWTSVSIDALTPMFSILTIGILLATVLMILERQAFYLVQRPGKRQRSGHPQTRNGADF